jgi:hypothetical protein
VREILEAEGERVRKLQDALLIAQGHLKQTTLKSARAVSLREEIAALKAEIAILTHERDEARIDPRIDPKMPHIAVVQKIVSIIRTHGPIPFTEIFSHLPKTTGLTGSYISFVLKKLKSFRVIECTRKGHAKFVWVFIPEGEKPQFAPKKSEKSVMLRHMGIYRVICTDGRTFDRLEFHRPDLTWSNKSVTVEMDEVEKLAYIPDHATHKSGVKHLDIYAHKFVSIDDCIIPKLKPSDGTLPKWVHPIRARVLNATVSLPRPERPLEQAKKDFGDPFI